MYKQEKTTFVIGIGILCFILVLTAIPGAGISFVKPSKNLDPQIITLVRVEGSTAYVNLPKDIEIISGKPGEYIDILIPQSRLYELSNADLEYSILISDVDRLNGESRGTYHTLAQIEQMIQTMATSYPSITQLTTIGTTYQARNIYCLEISDNPGVDEGEPGVLFMGLHHAREWPTVEICLHIANNLTSLYGSNATITDLVNNRRTWIVPCVNPD